MKTDFKEEQLKLAQTLDYSYRANYDLGEYYEALSNAEESLKLKQTYCSDNEAEMNISYFNLAEVNFILKKINESKINIDRITKLNSTIKELKDKIENTILPYSIVHIEISNYHGINKIAINDLPINSQWIFLTGENGYGKTSVLQALTVGLCGSSDLSRQANDEFKNSKIIITYYNNYNYQLNIFSYNTHSELFTKIACYGSSRLNLNKTTNTNKSTLTYSLFNTDGLLLDIENYLEKWANSKNPKESEYFLSVTSILKNLLSNYFTDIKIEEVKNAQYEVFYIENISGSKLKFEQLAAGCKNIIAFIGDLLIRFLHQGVDISTTENIAGIVIIDEFDLHLHPKWQIQLVDLLTNSFPKIQFIVSTHSLIPILGAPQNSTFLKVSRNLEQGIVVEKVNIDVSNLLPNSILTSPLFDFETLIPKSNDNILNLRTENTFRQYETNDKITKRLLEFEQSNIDFPDNLFNPNKL